jgi:predicted glutamine amidotransferase
MVVKKPYYTFESFYKAYSKVYESNPDRDYMLHFRISTGGDLSKRNVHPHRLRKDLVFCHNGIFNRIQPSGSKSDTKRFRNILYGFEHLDITNKAIQLLLDQWFSSQRSKGIFFDIDTVLICNEKAGEWYEGSWFSNDTYYDWFDWEPKPKRNKKTTKKTNWSSSNGKVRNYRKEAEQDLLYSTTIYNDKKLLDEYDEQMVDMLYYHAARAELICHDCGDYIDEYALDSGFCRNCDKQLDPNGLVVI